MTRNFIVYIVRAVTSVAFMCSPLFAADWPMWRYDAGRTACSPEALPADLKPLWVRRLPPPAPAWPTSQPKLQFDACDQPVVAGKLIFVPSSATDKVTAYETETGREVWRFYAEAPVRFAPVAFKDKVLLASDDGHLYCLKAADGSLAWRFRAAPRGLRIIGNNRLTSAWPARGGPVVEDGTIYLAASIWPFMGIYYYALDADTGEVVWANSGEGARWTEHPHGAPSFASVAPQGYLAVAGTDLIVPGGRSTPGVFDAETGAYRYFHYDKKAGGGVVCVRKGCFFNSGMAWSLADGKSAGRAANPVLTDDGPIATRNANELEGLSWEIAEVQGKHPLKKQTPRTFKKLWQAKTSGFGRLMMRVGSRLYGADDERVTALDLPVENGASPAWQADLSAEVGTMLAADGKLFVVTREGELTCFGADGGTATKHVMEKTSLAVSGGPWKAETATMIASCGVSKGQAVVLGVGSGGMVEALVDESELDVIVIEPDARTADAFRRKLDSAGLYGKRVTVVVGDPFTYPMAPYLATLIASEDAEAIGYKPAKLSRTLLNSLRPYGGTLWLPAGKSLVRDRLAAVGVGRLEVSDVAGMTVIRRVGPLPGSDVWTHQYGDAANPVVNDDDLVRLPLGLLWFGGASNNKILPRHGHGPSPQVSGGRLIIEGPQILRCADVYTGTVFWEKDLPGIGAYHNKTGHQPGAGAIGGNTITLPDAIYVIYQRRCLKLDPATGETVNEFSVSMRDDAPAHWGYIGTYDDLLVAGISPVVTVPKTDKKKRGRTDTPKRSVVGRWPVAGRVSGVATDVPYATSSERLVVMDRHAGRTLWSRDATYAFRHNAIAIGGGKVFCLDRLAQSTVTDLTGRGFEPERKPTLYALDARTGKTAWRTEANVFGTWLGYSKPHDILVQGGSKYRDRARDEVGKGIVVYQGATGEILWDDPELEYSGPLMLHGNELITNGGGGFALALRTGKRTGWTWKRHYGCNTAVASRHLMTFRSGAAGFCDLERRSGTGNIGGFKSSCTSNLIPADGVLNAPDYTRTCSCAYQNQSSLALVHMPEMEVWTFGGVPREGAVGINFGAPGNRSGPGGTLWMDVPSVGGENDATGVRVEPTGEVLRHHASRIQGDLPWVAGSGVRGVSRVTVPLPAGTYTVRLVFAELDGCDPGKRLFDVAINGKPVLEAFDIARYAGGAWRSVIRTFPGVSADDGVRVTLKAREGESLICGLEAVRESR